VWSVRWRIFSTLLSKKGSVQRRSEWVPFSESGGRIHVRDYGGLNASN
jgi:hypothetical protein